MRAPGEKVSVDDPKYPGIWTVKKVNRTTCDLTQDGRDRPLRCPMSMLIDPTDSPVRTRPVLETFDPGELVRIPDGKFAGVYVVLRDNGEKLSVAKLGGDHGRYVRTGKRGLVRLTPAEVLR